MPSPKPVIAVRTDQKTIDKFKIVAESNKRSMSAELELQVIKMIKKYESRNGEIKIEE